MFKPSCIEAYTNLKEWKGLASKVEKVGIKGRAVAVPQEKQTLLCLGASSCIRLKTTSMSL